MRRRASWQMTTKPISIKDAECKCGGCAPKAVELTSGDLWRVVKTRLRCCEAIERAAEVSRGHSNHASGEGPNGSQ